MGHLSDIELPRLLRAPFLRLVSLVLGIDQSEVELPLSEYPSLNSYFTRRLRPGVRSWPADPDYLGSPVDGVYGQVGEIVSGRIVQAKGRWYSAESLLSDPEEAARFEGGSFVTIYLSPRDYHRIHAPAAGKIEKARHIPGALLPVNPPGVLEIPDLFPRNERVICYIETKFGRLALVAVGAINVGRISTPFDPEWAGPGSGWVTNRRGVEGSTRLYAPPLEVERGEEVMAFHLGSTVVLLIERGGSELVSGLEPGTRVRLGELLARPPS